MALNIKNAEVEQLAREVARMAGESKTAAIRRALAERKQRLTLRTGPGDKAERLRRLLEERIWPQIPPEVRGKKITKDEEEAILGFGPEGF